MSARLLPDVSRLSTARSSQWRRTLLRADKPTATVAGGHGKNADMIPAQGSGTEGDHGLACQTRRGGCRADLRTCREPKSPFRLRAAPQSSEHAVLISGRFAWGLAFAAGGSGRAWRPLAPRNCGLPAAVLCSRGGASPRPGRPRPAPAAIAATCKAIRRFSPAARLLGRGTAAPRHAC